MKLLGSNINGNYRTLIFDDGTKVRMNDLDNLTPEKPESLDLKITNKCFVGCGFCHEGSCPDGKHGDILNLKFIDTLLPYTELALGGGSVTLHPDLVPFLKKCKAKKLICNATVNQAEFLREQTKLQALCHTELIHGLGVSLVTPTNQFISKLKAYPNVVIHLINGVHSLKDIEKLYDQNLKILILGYKQFRRGRKYYSEDIKKTQQDIYDNLGEILKHFAAVSFDNLALKQLDVQRFLTPEEWEEFYMGDDGTYTMYVDAVTKTFALNSITPLQDRHALLDDIKPMFDIVRAEGGQQ